MQGDRSSFEGIWTNDDDTLAHINLLMKGRPRFLLFKPPFDSHGGAHPRSERRSPCPPHVECALTLHTRQEFAVDEFGLYTHPPVFASRGWGIFLSLEGHVFEVE
jgi:hypothetical protein